ncbi:hypothetical protein GGR57DRAFT_453296 [Xylariaceae sp. FL1272]|nr:hypothetical protein GGR57DRAFT_453296 [Xylariaceae sp. FL1272]
MASFIARRAALSSRAFSTSARRFADNPALKDETKRNPELYILAAIMAATFGGAGLYFGRSPTHSVSEAKVGIARDGMPWETEATEGKYRYHPAGDPSRAPKDAPSAVNVVVVPDVNLPKHLHEKYNKWGKDGY